MILKVWVTHQAQAAAHRYPYCALAEINFGGFLNSGPVRLFRVRKPILQRPK